MQSRISECGPSPSFKLWEGLGFTRQAGAKPVTVLRKAGLVPVTKSGREQVFSLDRANFHLTELFAPQKEADWDDRVSALRAIVEDASPESCVN